MTLVVRPTPNGVPFTVWMCSMDPPQRISSIVCTPTWIPVWVTDPASPFEAEARWPLVNTDNTGPDGELFSPDVVVVSESWEIDTRASAWR